PLTPALAAVGASLPLLVPGLALMLVLVLEFVGAGAGAGVGVGVGVVAAVLVHGRRRPVADQALGLAPRWRLGPPRAGARPVAADIDPGVADHGLGQEERRLEVGRVGA